MNPPAPPLAASSIGDGPQLGRFGVLGHAQHSESLKVFLAATTSPTSRVIAQMEVLQL